MKTNGGHRPPSEASPEVVLPDATHAVEPEPGFLAAPVSDMAAAVISAARGPLGGTDATAEEEAIRLFRTHGPAPVVVSDFRRRLASKAAAGAFAVSLAMSGGVAAAVTGNLPASVQGFAHRNLKSIGISVPDQSRPAAPVPGGPGTSVADVVSGLAHDPALSGPDKGSAVCGAASSGTCTAHRPTTSTPSPGSSGKHGTTGSGAAHAATPATPATPAVPSDSGGVATPATPAAPATPADPGPPTSVGPSTTTTSTVPPTTEAPSTTVVGSGHGKGKGGGSGVN